MGVVLKTQLKALGVLFVFATLTVCFLCINVRSADAAVIIRPPNNLGLVGYWSFDEGRGTHASDMSGNENDGTLLNGPGWVVGKSRGALGFDGVNDYIEINNATTLQSTPTNQWSMGAWIYPTGAGGNRIVVRKDASGGGYYIRLNSTNFQSLLRFSGGHVERSAGTAVLNEWNHLVMTYDGTTRKHFLNGVEVGSWNEGVTLAFNTSVVRIGANSSTSEFFNGTIDEVRIYNRALSASEVYSLYANTKSTIVGVTPTDRYNNGLVAHWTFDGKHTTPTTVEDVVGNNDGTTHGVVPAGGIIGQAMKFDGVNDNISVLNSSIFNSFGTNPFSVAAWVKTTSTSFASLVDNKTAGTNNAGYNLQIAETNGRAYFRVGTGAGQAQTGNSITNVTDGEWHHLVGTRDASGLKIYVNGILENQNSNCGTCNVTSSQNLLFGSYGAGGFLDGLLDDVRIYNRALSANEVAGLYSATSSSKMQSSTDSLVTSGLVGHWSFDDATVSGNAVQDLTSNSNDGTVFGDSHPVAGKIGQAMMFDGSGDYIRVSNIGFSSNSITVAFWAQIQRTNGLNYAFDTNNERDSLLKWSDQNTSIVQWGLSSSYPTFNQGDKVNQWAHYALVANGINEFLYINGVKVSSIVQGEALINFEDLWIGAYHGSGYSMLGLLDDFRIYNRALADEEITQLYSMGQ
jgi:hypothetical protein